jgi:hypothetical protein
VGVRWGVSGTARHMATAGTGRGGVCASWRARRPWARAGDWDAATPNTGALNPNPNPSEVGVHGGLVPSPWAWRSGEGPPVTLTLAAGAWFGPRVQKHCEPVGGRQDLDILRGRKMYRWSPYSGREPWGPGV